MPLTWHQTERPLFVLGGKTVTAAAHTQRLPESEQDPAVIDQLQVIQMDGRICQHKIDMHIALHRAAIIEIVADCDVDLSTSLLDLLENAVGP